MEEPELVPEKKLNGVQGAVWQLDKEDMLMLLEDKKKDFLFVLYYYGYVITFNIEFIGDIIYYQFITV